MYVDKLRETESRVVFTRGWGVGEWEILVKEYKLPRVRSTSLGILYTTEFESEKKKLIWNQDCREKYQ